MRGEWFHTITQALKTIRRRVHHSCSFGDPTDNNLAFTVTEPRNAARKTTGKLLFYLSEWQLRQRLLFERARPSGKRRRRHAGRRGLEPCRHKRHQCSDDTRNQVVATTHTFLLLNINTIEIIPAAPNTNAITPPYSWPQAGMLNTPASR